MAVFTVDGGRTPQVTTPAVDTAGASFDQFLANEELNRSPSRNTPRSPRERLENAPDGRDVYTLDGDDTLDSVAEDYGVDASDLAFVNDIDDPAALGEGDTIVVLTTERVELLRSMHALQEEIDALDAIDPALRAGNPEIDEARSGNIAALRALIEADLALAARGHGHDADALAQALDARAADLEMLGPGLPSRLVADVRADLQDNINTIFSALGDKVDAALADPAQWAEVEAAAKGEFMALIHQDPVQAEALINLTRNAFLDFGPADGQYQEAITGAANTVLVEQPAAAVISTYEQEGTVAGLRALYESTKHASPDLTVLIVQEIRQQGTFDPIMADIAALAEATAPDRPILEVKQEQRDSLNNAIGYLGAVVDRMARSDRGQAEVDRMASAVADMVADHEVTELYGPDEISGALYFSGMRGEVGLGLAVTARLADQGRVDEANTILASTLSGAEITTDATQMTVDNLFAEDEIIAAAEFDALSPGLLPQALRTSRYSHPELWESMEEMGLIAFHQAQTVDRYLPQLEGKGLDGYDRLQTIGFEAATADTDGRIAFAMASSDEVWDELTRNFLEGELTPESGPPDPFRLVRPDPSWYWTARSAINVGRETYEIRTGQRSNRTATSLGKAVGGLQGTLFLLDGIRLLTRPDSDWVYKLVGGFLVSGAAREYVPVAAAMVHHGHRAGKLQGFWPGADSIANRTSSGWDKFLRWFERAQTGILSIWSLRHFLGYTPLFEEGNWMRGTAIGVAAVGSGLRAFGKAPTFRPRVSPRLPIAGAWITLIGIGADFAIQYFQQRQEFAREIADLEAQTKQTLIDAGVDPGLAELLADYDGDGRSVGPRLAELAEVKQIEPQELLAWLEEEYQRSPAFIESFVKLMHQVKPKDGNYPDTHDDGDLFITLSERSGRSQIKRDWKVERVTEDGMLVVSREGREERTVSPDSGELKAKSIAGIALWAEAKGTPPWVNQD